MSREKRVTTREKTFPTKTTLQFVCNKKSMPTQVRCKIAQSYSNKSNEILHAEIHIILSIWQFFFSVHQSKIVEIFVNKKR